MPDASEDCAEAGSLRAGPYPKSHRNRGPIPTPNSFSSGPKSTSPVLGGACRMPARIAPRLAASERARVQNPFVIGGPPRSRDPDRAHRCGRQCAQNFSADDGTGGTSEVGGVSSTTRNKQSTPTAQGAPVEERGQPPSPENLAELLGRGSLRKLYALQYPAWKEYIASVWHDFVNKSVEGKFEMAWNLLLAVKRFLFLPEDKLSQRQLARELRMRAHLEGSETLAPSPSQANGAPWSVKKRVEELCRAGCFSRAAKTVPQVPFTLGKANASRAQGGSSKVTPWLPSYLP